MFDPLIRSFLAGFVALGARYMVVQETLSERAPGTTPCPFAAIGGSGAIAEEWALTQGGQVFCFWRFRAFADGSGTALVSVAADATVQSVLVLGAESPAYALVTNPAVNPCDVNVDGAFNVYDFMAYLNRPYDWDGNGVADSADYSALIARCGGE